MLHFGWFPQYSIPIHLFFHYIHLTVYCILNIKLYFLFLRFLIDWFLFHSFSFSLGNVYSFFFLTEVELSLISLNSLNLFYFVLFRLFWNEFLFWFCWFYWLSFLALSFFMHWSFGMHDHVLFFSFPLPPSLMALCLLPLGGSFKTPI